jgi:hypothetical protein
MEEMVFLSIYMKMMDNFLIMTKKLIYILKINAIGLKEILRKEKNYVIIIKVLKEFFGKKSCVENMDSKIS